MPAKKPLGKAADVKTKPHGGPRSGAGRPSGTGGAAAQRSTVAANRIAKGVLYIRENGEPEELSADATPLDVMLMAMRVAYKKGGALSAHEFAKDAAPYIHARIAQMELKNPTGEVFALAFKWAGDE